MQDAADLVGGRDPREVLVARTELPAGQQLGEQGQLRQQATLLAEHQPGPQVDDADTGVRGRLGGVLPVDTDARQERCPGAGRLVDLLVSTGSVIADSRRVDQHRNADLGAGGGEQFGGADPRAADQLPVGGVPALVPDADPAEVDHRVGALQNGPVQFALVGVPQSLTWSDRRPADQLGDLMTIRVEPGQQAFTQEATRPRHDDVHSAPDLFESVRAGHSWKAESRPLPMSGRPSGVSNLTRPTARGRPRIRPLRPAS